MGQLEDYIPTTIYPPENSFSYVRLETPWVGRYQKVLGEDWVPFREGCLSGFRLYKTPGGFYEKHFLVQPQGRSIRGNRLGDMVPLWAYGAQQVGDDIHPLVFTLEEARGETLVQPSSLLSWRGQEARTAFQDVFTQDQLRTFVESIEAGMACIHLEVGIDEAGVLVRIPYYSYRLDHGCVFFKKGD